MAASDGVRGLAAFEADPQGFDVVVLDLSMAPMDGHECLRRLRAMRADIPVLISSGFDESDAQHHAEPHTVFLQKPYRVSDLHECLARLLDG